jgi:hypothetical protein
MSNKRFIPGIYNTCDYWCERCAFTRRCRNFSMGREMERESRGEAVDNDATNAEFWNRLADKVRETSVFGPAREWANDATGDLDVTPDPEWEARHDAQQRAVKRHPLVLLAHDYMNRTGAWLKAADEDLKAVAHERTVRHLTQVQNER